MTSPITNADGQPLPDNNGAGSTTFSQTNPQPKSNADNTGSGANQSGPFDATGVGQVQGGICAGCVGKADNKNPNGQSPTDKNNGYECDNNPGIGNGNPAHTACVPGTNTPPPSCTDTNSCQQPPSCTDTNSCEQPPSCTDTNSCQQPPSCTPSAANNNCGQSTVVQGTSTSTCAAGTSMVNGTCTPTQVEGETLVKPTSSNLPAAGAAGVSVAGVALAAAPAGVAAAATSRTLPFTGSNTGELAGLSLVLLVAGSLLVLVSRRRRPASDELAFSGAGSHGGGSASRSLMSAASAGYAFGPAPWERAARHPRR